MHANQFQARPNLLHTRSWDPYFCKKEESCKFLFAHILSNDAVYACRIPLASFESWDFGLKIGLHGLHGLDQVWTPLPPDEWRTGCQSILFTTNGMNVWQAPLTSRESTTVWIIGGHGEELASNWLPVRIRVCGLDDHTHGRYVSLHLQAGSPPVYQPNIRGVTENNAVPVTY